MCPFPSVALQDLAPEPGDNGRAEEDVTKDSRPLYRNKRDRIGAFPAERVNDVRLRCMAECRLVYGAYGSDVVWSFWSYSYHVPSLADP
jgi:hypothetical protein